MIGAGWLARDPRPDNTLPGGFAIDRAKFPTRYEEYMFACNALNALDNGTPGIVLDAGTGYDPTRSKRWAGTSSRWTAIPARSNSRRP
jgi:hypothetical protein